MSKNYAYYDKKEQWGIIATNIRKISEVSGIGYHHIYSWFRGGKLRYEDENCLCYKTEVLKGNQRIKNQTHGNPIKRTRS